MCGQTLLTRASHFLRSTCSLSEKDEHAAVSERGPGWGVSGAQGPGDQRLGHRGVVHQGLGWRPPQLAQGQRGEARRGRGRRTSVSPCSRHVYRVQVVT